MALFSKKHKEEKPVKEYVQNVDADGEDVLTKTENFLLYVITSSDNKIIGTVLLTKAQASVLNKSCNPEGIFYKRRLQ